MAGGLKIRVCLVADVFGPSSFNLSEWFPEHSLQRYSSLMCSTLVKCLREPLTEHCFSIGFGQDVGLNSDNGLINCFTAFRYGSSRHGSSRHGSSRHGSSRHGSSR